MINYDTGTYENGTVVIYCAILALGDLMSNEEHTTTNGLSWRSRYIIEKGEIKA